MSDNEVISNATQIASKNICSYNLLTAKWRCDRMQWDKLSLMGGKKNQDEAVISSTIYQNISYGFIIEKRIVIASE